MSETTGSSGSEPMQRSPSSEFREKYAENRPLMKPVIDAMRPLLEYPRNIRTLRRHVWELVAKKDMQIDAVRQQGETDPLTNIDNLNGYKRRIAEEIDRMRRQGTGFAYLLCDLNGLHETNELEGKIGGDAYLVEAAAAMRQVLRRKVDWVARIGGDEFVIILPGVTKEGVLEVYRKLEEKFQQKKIAIAVGATMANPDRFKPGKELRGALDIVQEDERIQKQLKDEADKANQAAKPDLRRRRDPSQNKLKFFDELQEFIDG